MGFEVLAVLTRVESTLVAMSRAAERAGLAVQELTRDPSEALDLASDPRVAWYVAGGYAAALADLGAPLALYGPTPEWFVTLPEEALGRRLRVCTALEAAARLEDGPQMVKLADGKHPLFSARWVPTATALREMLETAHIGPRADLLVGDAWLALDSEYRVFLHGTDAVGCSPYLVEGEMWSPDLRRHSASFHDEAEEFATQVLRHLPAEHVPPCCVLDVGRTPAGRMVLIEANNPWSSGIYGCDPDGVLLAVLAANDPANAGPDDRWRWRPDLALLPQL